MKSSEEWSSELWTQFMQLQLRKKPEKNFPTSSVFEPVTSRYRCEALTNWAMKPLMLGAGQLCVQLPKLLDVTLCVRVPTLLHVVGSCLAKFETASNISFVPWSPKRSATKFDPFAQLFQHCWGLARGLHMVCSEVLWVVSFPRCTAGPKIVGSCYICLHTTANTDATTRNIVGPITLGVVASVCTCWILHIQPTLTSFRRYR